MGFNNSSRLKFSPDFQNTEKVSRGSEVIYKSNCSALIKAVKYPNFLSSSSKLDSVTCKFTKNYFVTVIFQRFSK